MRLGGAKQSRDWGAFDGYVCARRPPGHFRLLYIRWLCLILWLRHHKRHQTTKGGYIIWKWKISIFYLPAPRKGFQNLHQNFQPLHTMDTTLTHSHLIDQPFILLRMIHQIEIGSTTLTQDKNDFLFFHYGLACTSLEHLMGGDIEGFALQQDITQVTDTSPLQSAQTIYSKYKAGLNT